MLGQRRRRWANIKPTLDQHFVSWEFLFIPRFRHNDDNARETCEPEVVYINMISLGAMHVLISGYFVYLRHVKVKERT